MDPLTLLRDLLRHQAWADARLWGAVLSSPAACVDPRLRQGLHHLHLVQRAFLHVWRGLPLDSVGEEALEIERLARWALDIQRQLAVFAETLTPAALDAPVLLPWAARLAAGNPHPATPRLADSLLQLAGHSGHHRGQLCARLRELGAAPPPVDYLVWVIADRPAADWPVVASPPV